MFPKQHGTGKLQTKDETSLRPQKRPPNVFLSMFHRQSSKFWPPSSQSCPVLAILKIFVQTIGWDWWILGMEAPQPRRICLWTPSTGWSSALGWSICPTGFILGFPWVMVAGFQHCTCKYLNSSVVFPMISPQLVIPCLPLAQEVFISSLMLNCLFGFLGTRVANTALPHNSRYPGSVWDCLWDGIYIGGGYK